MKVSIITPCFNSSKFISQMIESVLCQSYTNWELLIVDDFSNDDSIEIVKKYIQKDNRIKLIKLNKNKGPAIARNTAIEVSTGRFIAFLDSDDVWLPSKLKEQIKFMQNNKLPFTFTTYERVDESGKHISNIRAPEKLSYYDLLRSCTIGCLTVIYDTDFFGKVYMPNLKKRQDFCLWLKLVKKSNFAYGFDCSLAKCRVHSDSISSNKFNAALYQWRVYRNVEKLSLAYSIYYFIHYALNGIIKNKLKPTRFIKSFFLK